MDLNINKQWELISSLLNLTKDLEGKETKHQDAVLSVLNNLGWTGESIDREYYIQQGSSPTRVDFVLLPSDGQVLPIEVKTANSKDKGVKQLGSYMLHLEAEYGILVRDKIYFFYDERHGKEISTLEDAAFIVPFSVNCNDGEELLRLLAFDHYDSRMVKSFLRDELQKKKEKKEELQVKNQILKKLQSEEFVREAIKDRLIKEGFDINKYALILDHMLKECSLMITPFPLASPEGRINNKDSYAKSNSSGNHHKFHFEGRIYDGCNRLAFEIIKKYVETTKCSESELRKALNNADVTTSVFVNITVR